MCFIFYGPYLGNAVQSAPTFHGPFANNLMASDHKLGGEVKIVTKVTKAKVLTCSKCKRKGHEAPICRVRVCEHCGKTGHLRDLCFVNPLSSNFKGSSSSFGSPAGGSAQVIQPLASASASGTAHIINGDVVDYEVDDVIEDVVGGKS